MTKIQWTNRVWNPIVGCSKVSAGCKNCYAIGMAWRLQHIGHSATKYAGTVAKGANGQLNWTGKLNTSERDLLKPLTWKKPAMIFVNSESDLFHETVPFQVVRAIFGVMSVCKQHTFQILTKRPRRMFEFFEWLKLMDPDWQDDPANYAYDLCVEHGIETGCGSAFETDAWPLKNVWLGVSVENQPAADERIPLLLQVPAAVRFLSCEPLLSHIRLQGTQQGDVFFRNWLNGSADNPTQKIDWVIAGGESGKGARPVHPEWVRSLRDQCQKAGTAFFLKQWGEWKPFVEGDSRQPDYGTFKNNPGDLSVDEPVGTFLPDVLGLDWGTVMSKVGKKAAGRLLDGREWNEFPVSGKRTAPVDDPDLHAGGFDY